VVQRIDWEGTGAIGKALFSAVDSSSTSVRVTGEALAVEVMQGRWLFALLKGGEGWQGDAGLNAGFAIAVPLGHFARSAEGARDVVGFPKDTPLELPREAWPLLVTFDDVAKPETVQEVDPADLAAVFGEGVRLKAVTLEITREAVTEGRVDQVLGHGFFDTWTQSHLAELAKGNANNNPYFSTLTSKLNRSLFVEDQ
jgi:hypothetical protein